MRTFPSPARRRRLISGFVAGFAAVVLLLGGGTAVAYWTANAVASGTASSVAVSVTQAGFGSLAKVYLNSTLIAKNTAVLASTGSFTVTNTGAAAGDATVTVSGAGSLGPSLRLQAWVQSGSAPCGTTVPSGATVSEGTWASTTITVGSLGVGRSATVCVLTTAPDRHAAGATDGSDEATATAVATLRSGGWTATSAALTAKASTDAVFPLDRDVVPASGSRWVMITRGTATSQCLDIFNSEQTVGSTSGFWGCFDNGAAQPSSNRVWQLVPSATDRSLVSLRVASAPDKALAVSVDGKLTLQNAANTAMQQFFIQKRTAGYQLVSAYDGRCVNTESTAWPLSMSECNVAGVTVGISAPILPTISGKSGTGSVIVRGGFYRYNVNGATYNARFLNANGTSVASCIGLTNLNPPDQSKPVNDSQRNIVCSVAAGTYTVEMVATTRDGGPMVIHRFTATVTSTGVSMGAVQ